MSTWSPFGVTLLDPWFLAVIPLALLAAWWRARTPRAALPTAAIALFAEAGTTWRHRCAWLPAAAKVLAALCLATALARPVQRDVMPLHEEGIDIVLVVDLSSSMRTRDMDDAETIDRITAAREHAIAFAKARSHDRVGLVVFGHYAELRCPLTLDEDALQAFLRALVTYEPGTEEDRTAIGTGVAKAVQLLRKSDAKSKVVVLLTDGQNNVDDILPRDAAKLAKDDGVRVHTIALGKGEPTPYGYQPLDFRELRAIAALTGGKFFQPKSSADLAAVYERIDELEKVKLEDPRYRTVDRFEWPLAAGLLCLVLALASEVLLFRRTP
jgi:Ca-activated chloride channel family protein